MKDLKISNYVPIPNETRCFWFVDTAVVTDRFYCDDDGRRAIGEPVYETMVFLATLGSDGEYHLDGLDMDERLAITEENARKNQELLVEKWSKIGIETFDKRYHEHYDYFKDEEE